MNKLFLAASLGLVLAACGGKDVENSTVAEPAAGEMPQAGDSGAVTGSPADNVVDTGANPPATSADAGAIGTTPVVTPDPMAPPATDPMLTPEQQATPPAMENTTTDQQPVTTPPTQ